MTSTLSTFVLVAMTSYTPWVPVQPHELVTHKTTLPYTPTNYGAVQPRVQRQALPDACHTYGKDGSMSVSLACSRGE